MVIVDVATTWGTTLEERRQRYGCDSFLPDAHAVCWRGVDVAAPVPRVFRQLCQLRVAPYSYDWIDNLGRRSPADLTPGLADLEVGQRFMTGFELVAFERDYELTLLTPGSLGPLGRVAVTYRVVGKSANESRLLAKLRWRLPGIGGRVLAPMASWADLVMMRRQLLNLKRLAEQDYDRALALASWQGDQAQSGPRGTPAPSRMPLLPPPPRSPR